MDDENVISSKEEENLVSETRKVLWRKARELASEGKNRQADQFNDIGDMWSHKNILRLVSEVRKAHDLHREKFPDQKGNQRSNRRRRKTEVL